MWGLAKYRGLCFACNADNCLRSRKQATIQPAALAGTVEHQRAVPVNRAGAVSTASRAQQEPATTAQSTKEMRTML